MKMDQTCCEHITRLNCNGTTISDAEFRGFWWTRCVACKERKIYSSQMFECTVCKVYVHKQCWDFAGTCVVRSAAKALSTVDRGCQTTVVVTTDSSTEAAEVVTTRDAGTQTSGALASDRNEDEETEWWSAGSEPPSDREDDGVKRTADRAGAAGGSAGTRRLRSMFSTVWRSAVNGLVKRSVSAYKFLVDASVLSRTGTTAENTEAEAALPEQPFEVSRDVIATVHREQVARRLKSSRNKSLVKLERFRYINVYVLRCHYSEFLKKIADQEKFTLTYTQITDGTPENQYRVRLDVGPSVSTTFGEDLALHLARENAARDCLLFFRVLLHS